MKLSDLLSDLGRPVCYYPSLARIVGVKQCIFLCQLIYWTGKEVSGDGWIYKTRDDIQQETGLSHEEQLTARNSLKKLGILEERQERLAHKTYYRVISPVLDEMWTSRRPETGNHGVGKTGTTASSNSAENTSEKMPSAKPEHAQFIDAWMRYYADRHKGLKYPFNGRDAKAVKELLAYFGDQKKLREFIKECHSRRGYPFDNLETLYEIHSNLARLVSALNPPSTNGFKKSESAAKREDRFEDPMEALVRKTLEEAK